MSSKEVSIVPDSAVDDVKKSLVAITGFYKDSSKLAIALIGVSLVGCSTAPKDDGTLKPTSTVQVVHVPTYSELPDVPTVSKPIITPWKYDVPRDMKAKPIIRNTTDCKAVLFEKQDAAFWSRCGEQPPILGGNVYIGFDQANFTTFQIGWEAVNLYINALEGRIQEVNRQRAEDRGKAAEARAKAAAEKARVENPTP